MKIYLLRSPGWTWAKTANLLYWTVRCALNHLVWNTSREFCAVNHPGIWFCDVIIFWGMNTGKSWNRRRQIWRSRWNRFEDVFGGFVSLSDELENFLIGTFFLLSEKLKWWLYLLNHLFRKRDRVVWIWGNGEFFTINRNSAEIREIVQFDVNLK